MLCFSHGSAACAIYGFQCNITFYIRNRVPNVSRHYDNLTLQFVFACCFNTAENCKIALHLSLSIVFYIKMKPVSCLFDAD